jgi:two-component system cell cycle sensor histidine kinase/response regulator CckA
LSPDPRLAGRISEELHPAEDPSPGSEANPAVPGREKYESLALLAGGVAHDFNNLLTAILGHAELAMMRLGPDASARRQVERIASGARKAADLASELLVFAGRGPVVLERHDLSMLASEVASLLQATRGRSQGLRVEAAPSPLPVDVDGPQLRQAITHLITNALQACEHDAGLVRLRTGTATLDRAELDRCLVASGKPGTYALLEVIDNGRGMAAHVAARAFEPFYSTRPEARGLGLPTVLGVVRSHGGALRLESAPGQGSVLTMLLPVPEGAIEVAEQSETTLSEATTRCVLVVDDEESVREVISEILESAGYRVLLAADGREALDLYGAHASEIDAVLLDMTMPRMNGVECFRALRQDHPGARVLLMSGYNEQDATGRFDSAGLAGFVQKPFAARTLLGTLERSLV